MTLILECRCFVIASDAESETYVNVGIIGCVCFCVCHCWSSNVFKTVGSSELFFLCIKWRFPSKNLCPEAKELLIVYESEAEQWATYLHSVFASLLSEGGIHRYDISAVSRHQDHFLQMSCYSCKLLILSRGLLEGLCPLRRFFLGRVLTPADHVVVLLCGVDSLTPLLELVPLDSDECLQISSEQDVEEYLSTVMDIVGRGEASFKDMLLPLKWESSPGTHPLTKPSVVHEPPPSGSPTWLEGGLITSRPGQPGRWE